MLNFYVIGPFACQLILFLHLYQRNRGHTLSSLWVRRVFQLLQLKFFIAIVLAFYTYYVGFLGKSCAGLISHSQASRLDFPALQSYSDSAMISDYVKICLADSYIFLLVFLGVNKYYCQIWNIRLFRSSNEAVFSRSFFWPYGQDWVCRWGWFRLPGLKRVMW